MNELRVQTQFGPVIEADAVDEVLPLAALPAALLARANQRSRGRA